MVEKTDDMYRSNLAFDSLGSLSVGVNKVIFDTSRSLRDIAAYTSNPMNIVREDFNEYTNGRAIRDKVIGE